LLIYYPNLNDPSHESLFHIYTPTLVQKYKKRSVPTLKNWDGYKIDLVDFEDSRQISGDELMLGIHIMSENQVIVHWMKAIYVDLWTFLDGMDSVLFGIRAIHRQNIKFSVQSSPSE
jgi:hypothetical protein